MLSVRVVTVDHYLSKPIDELYGNEEKDLVKEWQEPVLRVFGATVDGIKTCVHVHGAYPYIYIPYKGGDNPERDALLLGAALDEALKTSFNAKVFRYIYKVSLVSGIHNDNSEPKHCQMDACKCMLLFHFRPLYGYHSKHRKFFKIYFFNPYHIKKASELLLSGAILGQKFQPHEAHIPYALQFMMDYNIYGMSFATFSKVKHRRNLERPDFMNGIKEEDIFCSKIKKMTWCRFEVDALASDIVNRSSQKPTGANPGLRAIWEDEKDLRRRQNKPSPITVPHSQSRPDPSMCPIELMYRERLAQKLSSIPAQGSETTMDGEEPGHVYPAEVPEDENILEASAMGEGLECPRPREVEDVSSLIDERILSEIAGSREKFDSDSEEDGTEADSVLGRNQKAEEEAELEDEEGVDMTQPLDSDESDAGDAEESRHETGLGSGGSGEEAFWRSMAEKICQLDGAEESSSESDVEAAPSGSASEERTSDGALECSSTWSTNIMSILSEDSGCPTPSTVCQTPRTFWSNYSPNWQPHDQDDCNWNRNCDPLPDLSNKSAADNLYDLPTAPRQDLPSGEPYLDLFSTEDNQYYPSSAVTLLCGLASTASPPHIAATPASDLGASAVSSGSLCDTSAPSPSEERPSLEGRMPGGRKPDSDRQKFLQVLKSFAGRKVTSDDQCCHLTLKQYIKDCREIVSVDFKNLCNQEMIVIEYKSRNKNSLQNKYLIKPLEKFLENWNSAERRVNDGAGKCGDAGKVRRESGEKDEGRNLRSVINVVESKFGEGSRVQSVRNRLTVKSMEILPEEGSGRGRRYNVNGNVISEGKIKMKLIKSRRENLDKNLMEKALKSEKVEKRRKSGVKGNRVRGDAEGKHGRCKGSRRQRTEWKSFSELDSKLISEINSSFEEYFESLVKRKNLLSKRKKKVIEEGSEDEEEEDDEDDEDDDDDVEEEQEELAVEESSEEEKGGSQPEGKVAVGKIRSSCRGDPIKFVTRFLSAFSRMSDVPPFSVTISLGSRGTRAPVEMNFEPPAAPSRREVKYYSKKRRKKMKLENVDGPADESSSSESGSGESKEKNRRQKRRKKEAYYKPLKVVVFGSPCMKDMARKKRRAVEEKEKAKRKDDGGESAGAEGRRHFSSGDGLHFCRQKTECRSFRSAEKKEFSSENEDLMKGDKKLTDISSCSQNAESHSSKKISSESNQEPDFIGDSDEERKHQRSRSLRRSRKCRRTIGKSPPKKIPQADTEAFTSSDDDVFKQIQPHPAQPIEYAAPATIAPQTKQTHHPPLNEPPQNPLDGVIKHSNPSPQVPFHGAQIDPAHGVPLATDAAASSQSQAFHDHLSVQNLSLSPSPSAAALSSQPQAFHDQLSVQNLSLSPSPNAGDEPSALTLSGNPLFASLTNSPQSVPNEPCQAECLSDQEHLVFGSGSLGQGSSDGARPWSRAGFGEEWGCESVEGKSEGRRAAGKRVLESNSIVPEQRPLTRKEAVESMQHYGILESEENAPFYSEAQDGSRAVEVGPRLLTIENRSLGALKTFKSSLDIMGTEERRNLVVFGPKTERWRLVKDGIAMVEPLKRPPSPGAVLRWLSDKSESEEREVVRRKATVKVLEPVNSGEEEDSGEEMELSVTLSHVLDGYESGSLGSCSGERGSILAEGEGKEEEPSLKKESSSKAKGIKELFEAEKLEPILEETESGAPTFKPASEGTVAYGRDKGSSETSFQIKGVTLDNTFGFSHSVENLQNMKANATHQYMDMLVVELHIQTRKDLCPDPDHDPIRALFYAIAFDSPTKTREAGVIVVGDKLLSNAAVSGLCIHYVPTEKALIETLISFVRQWDPEILAGYEIEMHSWGYLVQRAFVLEMNLPPLLGRVRADEHLPTKSEFDLCSGRDDAEDIPRSVRHLRISGRIVLDIWRVLRHEVALTSYSFENVMYHLAHERHPLLSHESLSNYWDHPARPSRHVVVDHYATRVLGVIRILEQLDFVARTSELSRLFGIQFLEVLSRGSQFRVESMMLRLAKPLDYIPASPSVAQRAAMRAPASLPLILEPESLFYTDPLIVLDFQSLYPSIIIAYNYCFSTCLGRVEKLGNRDPFEFGCTQLQIAPEELKSLENDLSISPAGVAFVKPSVRRGVLPTMLSEILETRLMVKKSMKDNKDDKLLQKVLFSRQLGLKLIANVTYGYTAANFSGRMPCIEVGDSVVSKGRETLHRAIQLVQKTPRWGARVVYGDTDSLFVLTPGRSREEAFKIGAEIAEAVTQDNPKPVKLKLEKVYQPSILQTKKRYLGYMYESPQQEKPVFEAKGIETVRRDGCPATGKVLEKALRILFDTRDVSLVKKYVVRQFAKLFEGRVNVHDLIFAKEYRGRRGYRPGACVPALHLARQWTQHDKRAEPRVKERVPYVIVSGPPGVPLIRLVRSPKDLLSDPSLRINAVYYITKALIPPLQRCFSLLGADVMSWYAAIPRKFQKNYKWTFPQERKRTTISQYFVTKHCVVCSQIANGPLCSKCEHQPQASLVCLAEKIRRWERCHQGILQICRSCCGRPTEIDCVSLDCPVLFRREQAMRALEQAPALRQVLAQYL